MPFKTKIVVKGIPNEVRYADDVGNPKYIRILEDGTYRFDIYIPRNKGESDSAYKQRIMDMGVLETVAKIYLE